MNLPPLDFVFPSEATMIQQDAAGVTGDPQLGVPVTYQHYVSRTFTPSTGAYTETYTDHAVRAVRNNLSQAEIAASGGQYQSGDVRFLVPKAGLAVTPNSEDRIVDGDGAIYDLIRWDTDPVGAFWRFVMRVGRVAP